MTQKIKLWVVALRLKEVALLVGLSLVAYPFAVEKVLLDHWQTLIQLYVGLCCFVAGVFALNNYSGYRHDKQNKRFTVKRGISSKNYFYFFLFGATAAIGIFYWLNASLFRLSLVVLFLWVIYYLPKYGLKYFPVTGLMVHLVAQIFQFQMGWVVFADLSVKSLAVSGYFALLWGAAYLNHELVDYEADKAAGVKTSAVKFGPKMVSGLSFTFFVIAHIFLLSLVKQGVLLSFEAMPFIVAFLLHIIVLAVFYLKNNLLSKAILYRNIYRSLYALATVALVIIKLKL